MPRESSSFEIEQSAKLSALIRNAIEQNGGWLGFDQFMNLALNAPGLGYYAAGAQKIGPSGDFITAPMLGAAFGQCLGRQCAEVLSNIKNNEKKVIVEFGAGTGQLCVDLLDTLFESDTMPDQYLIVETSADLKQRQAKFIRDFNPRYRKIVKWVDSISDDQVTGIIIGNELLDTMPVTRFRIDQNGRARALGISVQNDEFRWWASDQPVAKEYQQRLTPYKLAGGYQSEIGSYAESWVRTIGEKLKTGAMILIDYGFPEAEYYHWDRSDGTLMCHYRHTAHDNPLINIGCQDITSHVDFSAIANAAIDAGLDVAGYCGQGRFLLSLGLLDNMSHVATGRMPSKDALLLSQQIKKLTLPHEMGEIFKVIALTRKYPEPLSGFSMQNHRERL